MLVKGSKNPEAAEAAYAEEREKKRKAMDSVTAKSEETVSSSKEWEADEGIGDLFEISIEGWTGDRLTSDGIVIGKVIGDENTGMLLKERLREVIAEFAERHASGMRAGKYGQYVFDLPGRNDRTAAMRIIRDAVEDMDMTTLIATARTLGATEPVTPSTEPAEKVDDGPVENADVLRSRIVGNLGELPPDELLRISREIEGWIAGERGNPRPDQACELATTETG